MVKTAANSPAGQPVAAVSGQKSSGFAAHAKINFVPQFLLAQKDSFELKPHCSIS
jgi:hypothetical protein